MHPADDDWAVFWCSLLSPVLLGEIPESERERYFQQLSEQERLLPNGHLQITGRAKDVIVLASGKNIYPDELEGYYGQSELVDEMCIVGIADEAGRGERLHAVVVPDLEAARRRGYVNVREMITWDLETMGAKLPSPQRLNSLEVRNQPLPRTPTRKIKRFVLQQELAERGPGVAAAPAGAAVGTTDPEPLPPWAAEVCEVVARYAKVAAVEPHAHLDLDLGLESLDRIELMAELQRERGVVLPDETAGHIHTVGELIAALGGAPATAAAADAGKVAADNWAAVLRENPDGVERLLRRRPLLELFMWLVLRTCRGLWRMLAGFTSGGVDHLPADSAFMVCANHASYLDPFLLCMALPRQAFSRIFFVGYSDYFEGPIGRTLGRLFRNIPIDPNRNLERAMQAAAEGLRRDMVLIIFPEGGRSLDGSVREFRRGAAILSQHLNVPIVPAGIWGAYRAWPRGGPMRRHPVAVQFGEVLSPASSESDAAQLQELRQSVVDLVQRAENSSKH